MREKPSIARLALCRCDTGPKGRGTRTRWGLAVLSAALWSLTGLTGCDQRTGQAPEAKSSAAGPLPAQATGAASGNMPMPMASPQKDAPPMPSMSSTGPGPVPSFAGAASQAGGPVPMMQAGPKP